MPINDLENATGFQVFDVAPNGVQSLVGGGTFNPNGTTTFTPSGSGIQSTFTPTPVQTTQPGASLINSIKQSIFGSGNSAATVPATPSLPASGAASGAGSTGAAPTPVTSGGSTNPTQSDTASAATPGTLQNYFMRAVIIIVGFIFLAVGLNMVKPGIVPDPRDAMRS